MAIPTSNNVSELALKRSPLVTPPLGISLEELQRSIHIAGLLQSSLEVNEVLDNFLAATRHMVSFKGARFINEDYELDLEFGDSGRHSTSYNLSLAEENLGQLTLSADNRFSEQDGRTLEGLLCYLMYPLRNALLYLDARKAAQIDALTGAYNRLALDDNLAREIGLSQRHGTPLALAILDVDHFKTINDEHGHAAGDEVLKQLAGLIKSEIRGCDVLYRYGGEEFVILLANTHLDGALLVAERIRAAVEARPIPWGSSRLALTVSLGVTTLRPGEDGRQLFLRTDSCLYAAKAAGRNRVHSD